jgi:conjugal transfer ATP-binding protein TraC
VSSSLLSRPDRASLAGHLFYDSFDPDGRLFVHRDGSLALAWELGMKDTETSTPAALREIADRVADFFRHLPAGGAGQFILMSERDIESVLGRFRAAGTPGHRLEGLFDAHCQMLESLSISHGGTVFSGRTLRLYFTLRIFPDLGKKEEAIRAAYAREKGLLLEQAKAVEGFFSQLSLPARRLDAGEIVSLLFRILNPGRSRSSAPRAYREDLPIRDQVVRSALRFDYDSGVLTVDGLSTKVLSMVQIPRETTPGMVSRPAASGLGVLDLIPEAVLIFNFGVLDDAECRHRLEKRDAFAWRQLQGPRKKLDLVRIKEDAEFALGELMNGRRALGVRFHVLVSDPSSERVEEKARSVAATLDRLGIEMVKEDALGLSLFLQSLPMMYEPTCDRGLKRSFTMLSSNLADMLPLYGSFRGTPTPDVLLQNRRGEPVTLSLFDSDVAAHTVVTGVSGAGKSFFMNFLLASARRRGGHVIVLDKGNSYRNLSEIDGGQYVVFDPNRPLRINPIGRAEEMDKERLLFVKDILAEMASQGEEPVRKEERTILENAVLRAVAAKKTGEVFLSDVYAALLEEAKAGPRSLARDLDRLVLSLKPFVGNGAYAGFFDGPNEIDFERPFTVFEMGEIAKRREIASSLLMAILYNAAAFCGAPRNLARKKYLVIDEAWSLLQSPATARFIEEALRTYRKLNAAAVMVTQQVSDFTGPAGTAIRANAPNRVFLRQTSETVLAMEKLFELPLEVKEAISSLVTAKGRFSEMFVETPSVRGVVRLVPSPELYTAFSTDGDDRARLLERTAENEKRGVPDPLLSAIRELSRGASAQAPAAPKAV